VIGGERNHDRIAAAIEGECGASDDRRSGIAARRLEQNIGLDADSMMSRCPSLRMIAFSPGSSNSRGIRTA
jgi:hypothetical protein